MKQWSVEYIMFTNDACLRNSDSMEAAKLYNYLVIISLLVCIEISQVNQHEGD